MLEAVPKYLHFVHCQFPTSRMNNRYLKEFITIFVFVYRTYQVILTLLKYFVYMGIFSRFPSNIYNFYLLKCLNEIKEKKLIIIVIFELFRLKFFIMSIRGNKKYPKNIFQHADGKLYFPTET